MSGTTLAIALLVLLAAILCAALYSQLRRNRRLRAQLETAAADLQHLQQACSRLAPVGLVQRLVADGVNPGAMPAAEHKVVTALFADLVGYTQLSERLEPTVLAHVLEGYFQRISDCIHAHGGHIATFLGDGTLAYFGALHSNPWQCSDSVRAALAIREAIARYNDELAREGLGPLAFGIGIHRGSGLVGLGGSRERMEYSFVGPTVNLAARLQALTRDWDVDILVSEAVQAELDPRFLLKAMPPATVKGVAGTVTTYAVREMLETPARSTA